MLTKNEAGWSAAQQTFPQQKSNNFIVGNRFNPSQSQQQRNYCQTSVSEIGSKKRGKHGKENQAIDAKAKWGRV